MTEQRIRAPELPDSLEWLNTEAPVRIAEQRGKVVLLDFWSYCCINCMHVLPDLRYLEEKYEDRLTVIGLHTPKFPHERAGRQVAKAINRYHIRHPVANDPEYRVWKQYGIRAWPSIIFIDPEGYILGVLSGEGRRKQLDSLITEHLERADAKGMQPGKPVSIKPLPEPRSVLSFPGKISAVPGRLYIADSGHNRIIEAAMDGQGIRVYGAKPPGFTDGNEQDAAFANPQGMVRVDDFLFVADTDNHALRRIALRSGDVDTVAGTGRQGRYEGLFYDQPGEARLNSPWDLAYHDGNLYIAMAGQHQIWNLQLTNNALSRFVGSGREALEDGEADEAAMAQPTALSVGDYRLFVADSETSAIRMVRLPGGQTRTLVGAGLFEFGDRDGVGAEARLQHNMGVAYDPKRNVLWIADTYNSKIKRLDLSTMEVTTVAGCEDLDEPGGVCLVGDTLWIANTNAHEIRRLDADTGECESVKITLP